MPEKESVTFKLMNCAGVGSLSLLWMGGGLVIAILSPNGSPVRIGGLVIVALGFLAFSISLAVGFSIWNDHRSALLKGVPALARPLGQESPKAPGTAFEVKALMLMAPSSCLVIAIGLVFLGVTRNFTAGLLLMGAGLSGLVVMAVVMAIRPLLPEKTPWLGTILIIAVPSSSAVSFAVGWILLDLIPDGTVSLTLMALGGLGFAVTGLMGVLCGSPAGSSAGITSGSDQAARENHSVRWMKGAVMVLFVLVSIPFYGYGIWWRYSHRPKADTVGYAELYYSSGGTVRLVLPPEWRVRYRGRNRAKPHEANIEDQKGQFQFHLYVRRLAKPTTVEHYARETIEQWHGLDAWQKGGWEVEQQEFRESAKGNIWLHRLILRDGNQYGSGTFDRQPVVRLRYAVPWEVEVRIFEFDVLATQVNELEPVVWRTVSEARNMQDERSKS